MGGPKYTAEQEEWLRQNYSKVDSYEKLVEQFNRHFDTTRCKQSIMDKCTKRLNLSGMPNKSQYGLKEKEQLPLGTIRKSQTGTYVKVLDVPRSSKISGYQQPYWLPLQKKIYQDAYGEIESNQMICFLDGDTDNFELSNLYCIDRRISAIMSKNAWWTHSREHTLAAIKWCELHYALKELKGE